jgi:hypothetical protein
MENYVWIQVIRSSKSNYQAKPYVWSLTHDSMYISCCYMLPNSICEGIPLWFYLIIPQQLIAHMSRASDMSGEERELCVYPFCSWHETFHYHLCCILHVFSQVHTNIISTAALIHSIYKHLSHFPACIIRSAKASDCGLPTLNPHANTQW